MSRNIKKWIAPLLSPFAAAAGLFGAAQRLWAFARLRSELPGTLDPTVVVYGVPAVLGTRKVQLGRNLLLYPGLHLETQGEGKIEIGDNVVISRGVHIVAFTRVTIGANCMIGEYSSIRDANHLRLAEQPLRDCPHVSSEIVIGENTWIGRGVSVLAGVTIGTCVTVGANAVVTKDIPSGCLAVGVPARPVGPSLRRPDRECVNA